MAASSRPDRRATLAPLLKDYRGSHAATTETGVVDTGVPGVIFFWMNQPVPRAPLLYNAGIVIIGQGHKVGYLGGRRFEYGWALVRRDQEAHRVSR